MGRSTLLGVALLALLACAAGQIPTDHDEFSLLNIPRPSIALPGSGMNIMNIGDLMDQLMGGVDAEQATEQPQPRVTMFHLPPALSGIFRRIDGQQKEQGSSVPKMTMRIGLGPIGMGMMPMMPSFRISQPLDELRNIASNCVPCGRVQSHMRSISIMHGPDGQRVETVTETGPDGEQHTTRRVTDDDSNKVDDIMSAVLSPLQAGVPDFGRIMQDVESAFQPEAPDSLSLSSEPVAPQDAAAAAAANDAALKQQQELLAGPKPVAPKEVSEDSAKKAVETAVTAQGLDVESPEKRKELAASIAQQLGVSPDAVKVVASDAAEKDEDEDEEAQAQAQAQEASRDASDAASADIDDEDLDALGKQVEADAEEQDHEDDEKDAMHDPKMDRLDDADGADEDDVASDADAAELGKDFEEEEEEKKEVLRREGKTLLQVSNAAAAASIKAQAQEEIKAHLEALEKQMQERAAALSIN